MHFFTGYNNRMGACKWLEYLGFLLGGL